MALIAAILVIAAFEAWRLRQDRHWIADWRSRFLPAGDQDTATTRQSRYAPDVVYLVRAMDHGRPRRSG